LQDHDFFLRCGAHLQSFEPLPPPAGDQELPVLPGAVKPTAATRAYRVTDIVHTLPAGLWDSNVVSTYEITDTADGVFVRIRSPLSVIMDTVWEVREAAGGQGGLELVQDIEISCSRVLVGTVKGLCEGGWEKIHASMLARLEESGNAVEGEN